MNYKKVKVNKLKITHSLNVVSDNLRCNRYKNNIISLCGYNNIEFDGNDTGLHLTPSTTSESVFVYKLPSNLLEDGVKIYLNGSESSVTDENRSIMFLSADPSGNPPCDPKYYGNLSCTNNAETDKCMDTCQESLTDRDQYYCHIPTGGPTGGPTGVCKKTNIQNFKPCDSSNPCADENDGKNYFGCYASENGSMCIRQRTRNISPSATASPSATDSPCNKAVCKINPEDGKIDETKFYSSEGTTLSDYIFGK